MVILPTRAREGLLYALLGSVTSRVARLAPCPVLVVREQEHEFSPDESRRAEISHSFIVG